MINSNIDSFITFKKAVATCLVPVLIIIAVYSFSNWISALINPEIMIGVSFKNINNIFFDEFFLWEILKINSIAKLTSQNVLLCFELWIMIFLLLSPFGKIFLVGLSYWI